MRTRIRIDRLVLDGLPPGTTQATLEQAVRRALEARLGATAPAGPASASTLRVEGRAGSLDGAAGDVASAVAKLGGTRR